MKKSDLLLEIGCEELPAYELGQLIKDFSAKLGIALNEKGLAYNKIQEFATPRRLALIIEQVDSREVDRQERRRGPSVENSFDEDGKPKAAALGFAKSCGVKVNELQRLKTNKGEYLSIDLNFKGRDTKEILPLLLNEILGKLAKKRTMRWHEEKQYKFVRPIRWLVALLDSEVIPWSAYFVKAGRETRGHRFWAPQAISIKNPTDYEKQLKAGYVIPSMSERKERILLQVTKIATNNDTSPILDKDLLEELTAITEYPVAYLASFNNKFLSLPDEVLKTVLMQKQRYIPMVDDNNKISNKFIFIANIKSKDEKLLISGNESVVQPRLEDADFFYKQDKKVSLSDRRERLKNLSFLPELGNMKDRTICLNNLSGKIAKELKLSTAEQETVAQASLLCKCDLTTLMVQEFPELQGIMGGYYLAEEKKSIPLVTEAIAEHYLPQRAEDILPAGKAGKILSIANRIDTLVGLLHLGRKPSGESDPYAMRRGALGLVRILIEGKIFLDLEKLVIWSCEAYSKHNNLNIDEKTLTAQTIQFINERIFSYGKDKGLSFEILNGVFYKPQKDLYDAWLKAQAIKGEERENIQSLVEINKRLKNIIGKHKITGSDVKEELLEIKEEKELFSHMINMKKQLKSLATAKEYDKFLIVLYQAKKTLDEFFDKVMVMVDDEKIRNNRLELVQSCRQLFLGMADFSYISKE